MLTIAIKPASVLRGIFTRYAIGSVLAGVASEAVLLATYGPGLLGPHAASVAAWMAGAALNYGLNRWWAWGRRGRASLLKELRLAGHRSSSPAHGWPSHCGFR